MTDSKPQSKTDAADAGRGKGALAALDAWVNEGEWQVRLLPFVFYVAFLIVISAAVSALSVVAYPFLYVFQCGVVLWLLWRYRAKLTELNWKFHWSALPTGIGLMFAWVWLGQWMSDLAPMFDYSGEVHDFDKMAAIESAGGQAVYWSSISLRLLGMSLVVPMLEELFTRSLCLRTLHSWKATWLGLKQVAYDLPGIGDWFMKTKAGAEASKQPPAFVTEYARTKLGDVSLFAIGATTLVFMLSHAMRDWPGCIACGVVWCLMVKWTNREGGKQLGLGPVVWSHGITNAALWVYCYMVGSWEFL